MTKLKTLRVTISAFNKKRDEWLAALRAKGHEPIVDADGSLNVFVRHQGIHNGPGCSYCDETWCWHCSNPEDIDGCFWRKV